MSEKVVQRLGSSEMTNLMGRLKALATHYAENRERFPINIVKVAKEIESFGIKDGRQLRRWYNYFWKVYGIQKELGF